RKAKLPVRDADLTLARCVPFRRIAEGTAVPIAAVLFFGEPSTAILAPALSPRQHRRSPACPIAPRCRPLIPSPRLPLPLISQWLPQRLGKVSPFCAVRTRQAALPPTGSTTAG